MAGIRCQRQKPAEAWKSW